MNLKVFIKRLGSQESGYSGDKPGQRGRYILAPKESWDFFPHLPETTRNSLRAIRVMDQGGRWIGVSIVYHNTAFHPNIGLTRMHDEKRIYRNKDLDNAFRLDRNVVFVMARLSEDSYVGLSDAESGVFAEELSQIAHPSMPIDIDALAKKCPSVLKELRRRIDLTALPAAHDVPTVVNQHALIEEFQRRLIKVVPTDSLGDPLAALSSVYRTQVDFATTVRDIYEGRCAVRKSALVNGSYIGLEAAHIYPRADSMNFLPSNGILISRDLHNAFDNGCWTLSADLRIVVHPNAAVGELAKFANVDVSPPVRHSAFKPFEGYLAWHRKNVYGKFQEKGAGAL
jgi:hypothetical protein